MSQINDIMWYLSFSDSSSSEIISWLWGETLHTTLSLSRSLPSFPIQGPHMYTKITCVKITVVFFWEGDLFCLKRWTTLLPRYSDEHKICQVGTSKLQNAGVRGVSTTVNSKLGQNCPAVPGLQGQTYTQFSCCSWTGKSLSKGSDSTPFYWGWDH